MFFAFLIFCFIPHLPFFFTLFSFFLSYLSFASTVFFWTRMSASGPAPPVVTVVVSDDNGSYQFNPPLIHAANGTIVSFQFSGIPGNHSVTQSSFPTPCQALANGFDSGFIVAKEKADGTFPTFNYTVTNDQNAVWFYCRQKTPTSHCNAGMVGGINGVNSRFQDFQDKAEGVANSSATSPQTSASGAPDSGPSATVSHPTAPVPVAAVVGGTIGALILIALCAFALVLRRRRRHHKQLVGMRPDPLIVYEKGPLPSEDAGVPILSAILREVRSLRRQMRPVSVAPTMRPGSVRPDGPPPKYAAFS